MSNENVINKIDSIEQNLSQSQEDRLLIQDKVQTDLYEFLKSEISRISSENSLKQAVETILLEKVNSKEENLQLTDGALLKLLEIVSKSRTDSSTGILGVLKEKVKVQINNNMPINPPPGEGKILHMTSDDVQDVKKFIKMTKLIDQLENSELSKEEK